jgi:hypothetical protein
VDQKPNVIGADALRTLQQATPDTFRQDLTLNRLTADDVRRKVSGSAAAVYNIAGVGSVTANVNFTTSLDRPKTGDVKVTIARRFGSFLNANRKAQVARAVVGFIRQDHDQIDAALKA